MEGEEQAVITATVKSSQTGAGKAAARRFCPVQCPPQSPFPLQGLFLPLCSSSLFGVGVREVPSLVTVSLLQPAAPTAKSSEA